MAKKNLTAYECIYISKYHFSSAEFLLLSSNPFTFFSAGFLYHLSFELLLKGLITLEGKKYARIHSLEKLIKNLNGKKQKDVNKIITKETLYGQHFLYTTGSDLRDKILKLEVVKIKVFHLLF
jgi:HEPN domain-containing protein